MAHRRHHSPKRSYKNIINKTFDKTVSVAKKTSKKYVPKVESGLENVGSKVINTGQKSIPFLQSMTRRFFGLFTGKSKTQKNRKN
jgi:hypothetical protein